MESLKGRRWTPIVLALGVLFLCLSLGGLVTAYYYSWRLTAPGLPAAAAPRYELFSKYIGLSSLGLLAVSIVLIGCSVVGRLRKR